MSANSEVFRISDKDSFLGALKQAKAGDIVLITNGSVVNLSGLTNITIPAGVTLKGDTETEDDYSRYPLLYTDTVPVTERINPLLLTGGDDVTITGLRIAGAYRDELTNEELSIPGSVAIRNKGYAGLTVSNCEITNWGFAGVLLDYNSQGNSIASNFIHNNRKPGYGYGIAIGSESFAVIEHNRFDHNRHDISGNGCPASGYTARYNVIGKHGTSHSFDMHGMKDEESGIIYAGKRIVIEYNEFHTENHWAVAIRGMPREYGIIRYNYFYGSKNNVRSNAIKQLNAFGNIFAGANQYEFDYRDINEDGLVVYFQGSERSEWLLTSSYSINDIFAGDFNGDGVDDVFVSDAAGRWYVSWGGLVSWQLLNENGRKGDYYIGDFTGNGQDDVLTAVENGIILSENGSQSLVRTTLPATQEQTLYLIDFNSDGKQDILFFAGDEWVVYTDTFRNKETFKMPFNGYKDIKLADFHGDKRVAVLWMEAESLYYGQDGVTGQINIPVSSLDEVAIGDFSGDGKDDILYAHNGEWRVFVFGTSESFTLRKSSIPVAETIIADINGDGKTDLIFRENSPQ